jgi:hypothetical protein
LGQLTVEDALSELIRYADWVRSFRATPGTFVGTALSILRGSLERPLMMREPGIPFEAFPLGGRIESAVERGRYEFVTSWDIHGSYPTAYRTLTFPRQYVRVANVDLREDGFALADIVVPKGLPFGPLPLHERMRLSFPVGESFSGLYPISELRMAQDVGAKVTPREGWIGRGRVGIFNDEWNRAVIAGRALGGPAGRLAKGTVNSLWGWFCMSGRGEYWSWETGDFKRVTDTQEVKPRSPATAARIVSRVRERLYREALCEDIFIVGCHTDGVLTETGVTLNPNGKGLGDWRIKNAGLCIDFLSPQVYRLLTGEGWKYTVAGMSNPTKAEAAFKRLVREDTTLRKRERRSDIIRRKRNAAIRLGDPVGYR